MNHFIPILFLFLSIQLLSGQSVEPKFSVSLEYSPAFTNMTVPLGPKDNGFRLGHNAFFHVDYKLLNHTYLTLGAGLLSTREYAELSQFTIEGIERIESNRTHTYGVVPIGLKYKFGSFYIHPEIGLGLALDRSSKQLSYLVDGSILATRHSLNADFWDYNDTFVPLMFSIGNEINIGKVKLLLGAKGFYSLTKMGGRSLNAGAHAYGFGVMTGVRM